MSERLPNQALGVNRPQAMPQAPILAPAATDAVRNNTRGGCMNVLTFMALAISPLGIGATLAYAQTKYGIFNRLIDGKSQTTSAATVNPSSVTKVPRLPLTFAGIENVDNNAFKDVLEQAGVTAEKINFGDPNNLSLGRHIRAVILPENGDLSLGRLLKPQEKTDVLGNREYAVVAVKILDPKSHSNEQRGLLPIAKYQDPRYEDITFLLYRCPKAGIQNSQISALGRNVPLGKFRNYGVNGDGFVTVHLQQCNKQ